MALVRPREASDLPARRIEQLRHKYGDAERVLSHQTVMQHRVAAPSEETSPQQKRVAQGGPTAVPAEDSIAVQQTPLEADLEGGEDSPNAVLRRAPTFGGTFPVPTSSVDAATAEGLSAAAVSTMAPTDWMDSVLFFETSRQPPRRSDGNAGRRPARRIITNSVPTPFENDLFCGHFMGLARPMHSAKLEGTNYPFKWHFGPKSRLWELRIQGRFKQAPAGELFLGIEVRCGRRRPNAGGWERGGRESGRW